MDKVNRPPPSCIPIPARYAKTKTVTAVSTPATTAKTAIITKEHELEMLDTIRSQVESSLDAFFRDMKKLQEILPGEGSSEQQLCTPESSVDLKAELKRHKELSSKLAAYSQTMTDNGISNTHSRGPVKKISSFQFLQSIMN